MLKIIIADDERIIRETISSSINWDKYNVEVIGLASNGIEAYDMIIDESPDIVLTDIKMPLMNGLELIKKVRETTLNTQFIILSGYGEFEYAKTAMKYGVKYYLLKPCNENQIIEAIIHCKKDCTDQLQKQNMHEEQFAMQCNMYHNIMSNIINDRLSKNLSYDVIFNTYSPFIDFSFTPYNLFSVYYLEYDKLDKFLAQLKSYIDTNMPSHLIYGIYVKNTLLLYFQSINPDYSSLKNWIEHEALPELTTTLEVSCDIYNTLSDLMQFILEKVKRFSMIYYINNYHSVALCNYKNIMQQIEKIMVSPDLSDSEVLAMIYEILNQINDINFFKQLTSSLIIKLSLKNHSLESSVTESLIKINKSDDLSALNLLAQNTIKDLIAYKSSDKHLHPIVQQINNYIEQNLSSTNLTLKYISENVLFMNVDYVSKKFHKETGQKFSQYLTDKRIQNAKKILRDNPETPITLVAELVGCENNPQYFSKLFKSATKMTPSQYIQSLKQ